MFMNPKQVEKSDSASTDESVSSQSPSPKNEFNNDSTYINELNKKKKVYFSEEEVLKHNTPQDLWVIINNKVYDVTHFQKKHPGGTLTLEAVGGKDGSQIFMTYHPKEMFSYLESYEIGELFHESEISKTPLIKDFTSLNELFHEQGLYKTSFYYYFKRSFQSLLLFVLAWYFQLQNYDSKWNFYLGSIILGIFFQQTAFIGHDCGHTAIFHNRKQDCLLGFLVGNTLTGISIGWWKDSHNTHHVVPNQINYDPDIQHLPFFAVTRKFFVGIYSKYHKKQMEMDFLARQIIQYQHFLYYPIMCIARFFLYLQSMLYILNLKPRKCEFFWQEALAQTIFFSWMKIFFCLCPDLQTTICCLLLSHAISGLLHIQITLSHFGMETFTGNSHYTPELNFIDLQLKSTVDISNHPLLDWFHGGLQFQLAHHLFPRMPRHNLPYVRQKVSQLLKKHGRNYNIMTFLEANIHTYNKLKEQAEFLKKDPQAKFTDSMLWEGLNARG